MWRRRPEIFQGEGELTDDLCEMLAQYHKRPETKFLNGERRTGAAPRDGNVIAVQSLHIGKGANKWEEQFFLGPDDEVEIEYGGGRAGDDLDVRLVEFSREAGESEAARKLGNLSDSAASSHEARRRSDVAGDARPLGR